jgi:hypothetical protein
MSLSDLASLGSFVSGVAVLASLVFLFFQMRQMTEQVRQSERNQQALAQQERASRAAAHLDLVGSDPTRSDLWYRGQLGADNMSLPELRQYFALFRSTIIGFEDAFLQHQQKLLGEAAFESALSAMRAMFALPGARAMWKLQHFVNHPNFAEFVDRLIAEFPARESRINLDLWRELVVQERTTVSGSHAPAIQP